MAYDVNRKPGAYAFAQADFHARQALVLFYAAMVLGLLVLVAGFELRNDVLAVVALLAMYSAGRLHDRRTELWRRWTTGANAETEVGTTLNELRRRGFVVLHDLEREGEGNVDHLVSGPTGVYLIETKARRYERKHLAKARRQAARLNESLGVWVTPVISLPARKRAPWRDAGVWIVPRGHLVEWIESQRNKPLDSERLADRL